MATQLLQNPFEFFTRLGTSKFGHRQCVVIGVNDTDPRKNPVNWQCTDNNGQVQQLGNRLLIENGVPVDNYGNIISSRVYYDMGDNDAGDFCFAMYTTTGTGVNAVPATLIPGSYIPKDQFKPSVLTSAENVAYKSGTVADALDKIADDEIMLNHFGADPTQQNNADKLQQVFDYAVENNVAIIDYSGKTYNYESNIVVEAANKSLVIKTNCSFIGDGCYIEIRGSSEQVAIVDQESVKENDSLYLNDTSQIDENDILVINNTNDYSFSSHRDYYKDGEYQIAAEVQTDRIKTKTPLLSTYPPNATLVYKMKPCYVEIDADSFISDGGLYALVVKYCANSVDKINIKKTEIINPTVQSVTPFVFNRCHNSRAAISSSKIEYVIGGNSNYGAAFVNSQSCEITGDFYGGRHGVSYGGDGNPVNPPNRFCYVVNSRVANSAESSVYAADIHGNAANCEYRDCDIFGAVGLAGRDCYAVNCNIFTHDDSNDIPLSYHEVVGGTIGFTGCYVNQGTGTSPKIIGITSGSLSDNIDDNYEILVDDLKAKINSNTTNLATHYENSGNGNSFILNNFGIIGDQTALNSILDVSKGASGREPSVITVSNPREVTGNEIWLTKSGTTLNDTIVRLPASSGVTDGVTWFKHENGMMTQQQLVTADVTTATSFFGGYRSGSITVDYAHDFIDTNVHVDATIYLASFFGVICSQSAASSATLLATSVDSVSESTSITLSVNATGRWF